MDTEKLIQDIVQAVLKKLGNPIFKETQKNINPDSGSEGLKNIAEKKIICSISVRHVHLCREHLDILYGKDYECKVLKELYQPKNYAYEETVTVIGPKLTALQNVRILGPLRDKSQVELAKTDCIALGINAPVRPSGKLEDSAECVLVGPKGAVYLQDGVIRANRHMHLSQEDADYFGIKDNQELDVRIQGPKGLTFNNVQVRVNKDFKSEMHIDTDDGNAADIAPGTLVEIVNASCITPMQPAAVADLKDIPPTIPDSSSAGEIIGPDLLKSIGSMIANGSSGLSGISSSANTITNIGSARTTKTVITVADIENYRNSGINLSSNVILSPLAKDEATARGIKINNQ